MQNQRSGFFGVFGSFIRRWLTDNPPFYPLWGNFFLQRKLPIFVDLNNLMLVYLSEAHLRLVIDKKAEMFANMKICLKDKNGDEILKHPMLDLFASPNPLQTQSDFLFMYSVYNSIYSQNFGYGLVPVKAFGNIPSTMWWLPPSAMKITPTGKIWNQTKIEDVIEKYTMFMGDQNGQAIDYAPEDIMHISGGVSDWYLTGQSKILSLKYQISNIQGALKTRNCIIHDRGAQGILSPDNGKGGDLVIPMVDKERKKIEEQYRQQYGINDDQMKTLITTNPMKYTPMTFPTKDLMLFEEIEDDFNAICGTFGMARDIFPSEKGATFENQDAAYKHTYQSTIQPEANRMIEAFSRRFNLAAQGITAYASFDHLPVMQEDELQTAQAKKFDSDAAQVDVQTVLNINDAIRSGNMTVDAGVKMLTLILEMSEDDAKEMIVAEFNSKPQPIIVQQNNSSSQQPPQTPPANGTN